MKLTLGSNIASLIGQRNLKETSNKLSRAYERLSSGMRINKASDDAAGLAIAEELRADIRVYTQAIRNVSDGISLLTIADSAVGELTNIVVRLEELAAQSANGIYSNPQRKAINEEAQALSEEYLRIAQSTKFNDQTLFTGEIQELRIQAGSGLEESIASELLTMQVGTGTFGSAVSYQTEGSGSGYSTSVSLADMNGDGELDLVTAGRVGGGSAGGYVTLRFGTGTGTFSSALSYRTEESTSENLAIKDLNNDGVLDLITAGFNDALDGYATIRLGLGNGTFATAVSYTTESKGSYGLSIADVDNNGTLDLITSGTDDSDKGYTTVRLGLGDGTFSSSSISYTAQARLSRTVVLADLNGDNKLDMVTGGEGSGGFTHVRLGHGDGTFSSTEVTYDAGSDWVYSVSLVDLNGDDKLDLVSAGYSIGSAQGAATVRLGNGDGTFSSSSVSYVTETDRSRSLSLKDLNGDGMLDMITSGIADGNVGASTIRLGLGNGTFSSTSISYATEATRSLGVDLGDLNNDGVVDLVTAGNDASGYATVRLADTRGGIGALQTFDLSSRADSLLALEEFKRVRERLAIQRGNFGAFESRLNVATNVLQHTRDNYAAARSQIIDADIADEVSKMVRMQILQNAGTAVLAQANQQPALVLQLLGGT